ncbi:uncharacterized protein LOC121289996 isoform X2 [Carcharodon carcharias]|uniref:uncharacterized protein LOC121289996 isoform X2 n=1 Tax=Carcharodon carcharias TaxID=13397 RepID=UPI001B7EBD85|nr:uncharacterized protein LOC121289996 isoform X2 [Carcharodon carcharias]
MDSRSRSVDSVLSGSGGETLAVSKSKLEDPGVQVSSTEACCPLTSGSERDMPALSRTVSLWKIPQVSMATPLARHRSELEVGQGSEEGVLNTSFPPLDPVHQKLERVLQRTLSRKQREASGPWEAVSDGPDHGRSLLSLKPLAQSQPILARCGKGVMPGSLCTLQRITVTNSMNDHLQKWEVPGSRAPGWRYLEQVCRLLDRIADLQERNSVLKQDKLQMEEKLRQKEKQQELLQHYCSCGSAALYLGTTGELHLRGHKDSPHLTHNSTTLSRRQPQHSPEHSGHYCHISLQKRWASDLDNLCEAKGGSMFHLDEADSCQYGSKDHLACRVQRETFQPNTAHVTKARQPHWGRVRDMLHRLKGKSRRRGSFVSQFKGSSHQNHRFIGASEVEVMPQSHGCSIQGVRAQRDLE